MAKQPTKARATPSPDRNEAKKILNKAWDGVLNNDTASHRPEIAKLVNSNQVAIRYSLPTQLLGKLTDQTLDTMCLQSKNKEPGQWDPRSFAVKVVSPWVRNNQNVLGTSGDPYVSNPLRRPRLDEGLDQMSDREEWEKLCEVLREVQLRDDRSFTREVFTEVLSAIKDRLRDFTFVYVVPPRISIRQVENLVERFLKEKSGGERGLAVTAAMFETFRDRLSIYKEIRRGVTNAADAASGSAGDLECVGIDGTVVLAVEVKERKIGDSDVHIAVEKARASEIREFLLCTEGILLAEQGAVERRFASAWASGTNIYHATIGDLIRGTFPLLTEEGNRFFIVQIGSQLDRFSTQPKHRKAWRELLDAL